jgi:hypothetical protein
MTIGTRDKALIGAAGSYYVAYRLAAERCAVGITAYGTRAIDLVVANPDTGKSVTIQTKTMMDAFVQSKKYPPYWKWQVGKFTEHATLFYAFVNLKGDLDQIPDVFIVPSMELRPLLWAFPGGADLESPEAKAIWCNIEEEDAPKYLNRWGIIKAALE